MVNSTTTPPPLILPFPDITPVPVAPPPVTPPSVAVPTVTNEEATINEEEEGRRRNSNVSMGSNKTGPITIPHLAHNHQIQNSPTRDIATPSSS
ncbi:unnamed protein product, partial [Arabidopsis halleri]